MAIDTDLFFARRLGVGLGASESLPEKPREWAMDQLRSVPPLDFFDKKGNSIAGTLPPYAKLIDNFEEAAKTFDTYFTAKTKRMLASKNMANDDFNKLMASEIFLPYNDAPIWRDTVVNTLTAVNGKSGVFERFWMFWCNHFAVATTAADIALYWGPHMRTIRDRMTGKFADMLYDAVSSPAMLTYLNNTDSVGPHSRGAHDPNRPQHDLNENLGRELLELHSVSPAAGYTQADVTETAMLLTGWRVYAGPGDARRPKPEPNFGTIFEAVIHEPGPRTVMGKAYTPKGDGRNMLRELTDDLAAHPATAQHLAAKLARAFLADTPPQDSIDRIAKAYTETGGDMVALHSAVVEEVLAHGQQYSKMTTPQNWLIQAYRATGARVAIGSPERGGNVESLPLIYKEIGQILNDPAQPNGYSDLKADWLSKAMLDRRTRQAYRIGSVAFDLTVEAIGAYAERLAGIDSSLVPMIKRAESRPIAVAVLLASPQFLKI
ncbi:MAG TPA: DUF1800 family protein [Bauldia sp.]|nr:DUF1800 family protein [Bauldia sp.]